MKAYTRAHIPQIIPLLGLHSQHESEQILENLNQILIIQDFTEKYPLSEKPRKRNKKSVMNLLKKT